ISCPADIVTNSPTACPLVVNFPSLPGATDNCGVTNLVVTPATGSSFPVGTNLVTAVATDSSGNTNSCTFKVIVLGNAASPVLSIVQSGASVILSWSNAFPCFTLQYAPELGAANLWTNFAGPLGTNAGNFYATNGIGPSNVFYRLKF